MKICFSCKIEKPLVEFYVRLENGTLRNSCKKCHNEGSRKWRHKNPERKLELGRCWYLNNPESARAAGRRWKKKNSEKTCESNRKWREKNRERIHKRDKCYREKNLERDKARIKQWYLKNRERALLNRRQWRKRPGEKQFNGRLANNLRSRVYQALKGLGKSARTLELLGCTLEFLRTHLEKQFVPGMSWENYGPVWHVDHILPCADFHLQHSEEQEVCFHWTNLQPLLAEDNRKKSDKIL